MCIRDRGEGRGIARQLPIEPGGLAGIRRRRKHPAAPVGACLLYTSDAADERSSVDLGGRRIIKNKKEESEM